MSFDSDSYTVNENAVNVMITLVTTGTAITDIPVSVSTMDGTALGIPTSV